MAEWPGLSVDLTTGSYIVFVNEAGGVNLTVTMNLSDGAGGATIVFEPGRPAYYVISDLNAEENLQAVEKTAVTMGYDYNIYTIAPDDTFNIYTELSNVFGEGIGYTPLPTYNTSMFIATPRGWVEFGEDRSMLAMSLMMDSLMSDMSPAMFSDAYVLVTGMCDGTELNMVIAGRDDGDGSIVYMYAPNMIAGCVLTDLSAGESVELLKKSAYSTDVYTVTADELVIALETLNSYR